MSVAAVPTHHRFTVDEYYRLAELGFLAPDARVELIDGEIIEMSPIGDRHGACVDRLNRLLVPQAATEAIVRVQGAVRLSDLSEPEPDVAILAYHEDFYESGKPRPDDVLLMIEVADSTFRFDNGRKKRLYASSRIVEYWVVDLTSDRVLVYTKPGPSRYGASSTACTGDVLVPRLLPDLSVPVSEVFGIR